jgi:hypothetical protein
MTLLFLAALVVACVATFNSIGYRAELDAARRVLEREL